MANALGVFLLPIFISVSLVSALAASVEEFYKGKTIQFVVGGSAGGGYDTYTRLIARHFAQYVPGKPSTVVQNMPGAAMLIAANYIFNSAPRDGTVIGHWSGPLILQHMMGNPAVQFEGRKFGWLGMPTADSLICITTERSGIKTAEDWRKAKTRVKLGAIGPGTSGTDDTKLLAAATDFPLQLIEGYKGTADIRVAAEHRGSRRYLRLWLAIGEGDLGQRPEGTTGSCRASDDARASSRAERCPSRCRLRKDGGRKKTPADSQRSLRQTKTLFSSAPSARTARANTAESLHRYSERFSVSGRGGKGEARDRPGRWTRHRKDGERLV